MATTHRSSDFGAALTGLVVGATVLFAICFAIVKLTNSYYGSHESTTAAAPAAASAPAAH